MTRMERIQEAMRRSATRGETRHAHLDGEVEELRARLDALEAAVAAHVGDKKGHR